MARIKLCGFGQCGLGFVYLIISLGLKALLVEYLFLSAAASRNRIEVVKGR